MPSNLHSPDSGADIERHAERQTERIARPTDTLSHPYQQIQTLTRGHYRYYRAPRVAFLQPLLHRQVCVLELTPAYEYQTSPTRPKPSSFILFFYSFTKKGLFLTCADEESASRTAGEHAVRTSRISDLFTKSTQFTKSHTRINEQTPKRKFKGAR